MNLGEWPIQPAFCRVPRRGRALRASPRRWSPGRESIRPTASAGRDSWCMPTTRAAGRTSPPRARRWQCRMCSTPRTILRQMRFECGKHRTFHGAGFDDGFDNEVGCCCVVEITRRGDVSQCGVASTGAKAFPFHEFAETVDNVARARSRAVADASCRWTRNACAMPAPMSQDRRRSRCNVTDCRHGLDVTASTAPGTEAAHRIRQRRRWSVSAL